MNADVFAEWLRRQHYKVVKTKSSYWYNAGPRVFQAFPYHYLINPADEELNHLMRQHGVIAMRFSRPVQSQKGKVSYHVVLRQPYRLEELRPQARNGIRKGLANCSVEQISFSRLAKDGWRLQKDTLARQDREKSMTQQEWESICLSAEGLEGFEAWAALVDGKLAASVITARVDDVCTVPYAQSHRDYLPLHVNNALFYSVCTEMLSRSTINEMFFNVQSLDAPESVDDFKFRMNFTPRPVIQQVCFNPLIKPFITNLYYRLVKASLARSPSNPFLAKEEGMIRFYLEGNLPNDQQTWPECLVSKPEQ